ncbi:MAG TPA: hypothetical protein VM077_02575 [Candidatus Limnocylindrales bacterium]|nr:hypothetical protein [Candidatus Limnocylindrales bacterium]
MRKFYNNKWIKWFFIPIGLFLFWIFASLTINPSINFSTLIQKDGKEHYFMFNDKLLLRNDTISGQFKASEDNLGIISIRFIPQKQVDFDDEDSLVFRIKEKKAKEWHYQGTYSSGGIFGVPMFPFGFPTISDSKNKTYIFSITSQHGTRKNAVKLSRKEPALISMYVFPKNKLISDKRLFVNFFYKKLINYFSNLELLASSTVYLSPLLFYLFTHLLVRKTTLGKIHTIPIIPLLIVLAASINIDLILGIFLSFIGFWIITVILNKIESRVSFLFALLFFCLSLISVILKSQQLGSRFSNWTFIFLAVGTVQTIYESQSSKKFISYRIFLKRVIPKKILSKISKYHQV